MGVLTRTLHATAEQRSDTVQTFTTKNWLGRITGPGAPVTPASAMRLAVVYTCIKIIAEAVGSLPLISYRRRADGGRERAPDFYLSELLQYEPNPEMEAVTFIETLTAHVAGWGNGYAEIIRDGGNRPLQLWPLRTDRMSVLRVAGALIYRYVRPDGTTVDLAPSQVLHIRGLSFDGLMGHSPLAGDQTIEMAQTLKDYGTSFYRNNARPAIVAMHPKTLSQGAVDRLAAQFEALKGSSNAGKTVVMEEGLSIQEIGIAPEAAQYLDTAKLLRSEIIGKFLIPPHRAGDVERSTSWGTGIAEQNQTWLDVGLGMYLRRWEQAIRRSLITSAYRSEFYAEFLRDALLRADPLSRAQINHIAWMDGRLSADDINEMENRNHLPDGKGQGYYVPLNMIPVEMAGTDRQGEAIRSWGGTPNPTAMPDPTTGILERMLSESGEREERLNGRFTDAVRALAPQPPAPMTFTAPAVSVYPEAPVVNVTLPEQAAPVVNLTLPEPRATTRTIVREGGQITRIIEEPSDG